MLMLSSLPFFLLLSFCYFPPKLCEAILLTVGSLVSYRVLLYGCSQLSKNGLAGASRGRAYSLCIFLRDIRSTSYPVSGFDRFDVCLEDIPASCYGSQPSVLSLLTCVTPDASLTIYIFLFLAERRDNMFAAIDTDDP